MRLTSFQLLIAAALALPAAAMLLPAGSAHAQSPFAPSGQCALDNSRCVDLNDWWYTLRTDSTLVNDPGDATGYRSTALGQGARASSQESTAIGEGARASGLRGTALGRASTASGGHSVAVGNNARAWSPNTVAVGHNALASLTNGTAVGQNSMAHRHAAAFGQYARAADQFTIAIGQGSYANASGASAIGRGAHAGWAGSTAIGAGARTERDFQMVFGGTANTYTLPGITSAASRSSQSGAVQLVTTDASGNLATDGGVFEARIAQIEEALGLTPPTPQAAPPVAQQQAEQEEEEAPQVAARQASEPLVSTRAANDDNNGGGLVGLRQAQLTEAQDARIAANAAKARENAEDILENTDGVALAMALYSPSLLADKRFAITLGYGHYKDAGAVGVSGSFKMTEDFYLSLGGGFGIETTTGGGRAAVTFMR